MRLVCTMPQRMVKEKDVSTYTESERKAFRNQFGQMQRRLQVVTLAVLLLTFASVWLGGQTGKPQLGMLAISIVGWLGAIFYQLSIWRCPACAARLRIMRAKECPQCGLILRG